MEVQVKNVSKGSLFLDNVTFIPLPAYKSTDLNPKPSLGSPHIIKYVKQQFDPRNARRL